MSDKPALADDSQLRWYQGLTWYHWVVVLIASCGWLFDCMDQRIFALARQPALTDVLGNPSSTIVKDWVGYATAAMMIGCQIVSGFAATYLPTSPRRDSNSG